MPNAGCSPLLSWVPILMRFRLLSGWEENRGYSKLFSLEYWGDVGSDCGTGASGQTLTGSAPTFFSRKSIGFHTRCTAGPSGLRAPKSFCICSGRELCF